MVEFDALAAAFEATNTCSQCGESNRPLILPDPESEYGFVITGWQCGSCFHVETRNIDELSTAELLGA